MDIREETVYVNICLCPSNIHKYPTWIQENMCCLNDCQNKYFPVYLLPVYLTDWAALGAVLFPDG